MAQNLRTANFICMMTEVGSLCKYKIRLASCTEKKVAESNKFKKWLKEFKVIYVK